MAAKKQGSQQYRAVNISVTKMLGQGVENWRAKIQEATRIGDISISSVYRSVIEAGLDVLDPKWRDHCDIKWRDDPRQTSLLEKDEEKQEGDRSQQAG